MNDASGNWGRDMRAGRRFAFGANWTFFIRLLNEDRIQSAQASLREMLGSDTLDGKTLVDVGSGSGLFSLAARQQGAEVVSFDYDTDSVACNSRAQAAIFSRRQQLDRDTRVCS